MLDVIIVGGGPAGLSAALILGRCRRRVLIVDHGRPRNAASRALHGFLTRDGVNPQELLALARAQLKPYETVELRDAEAVDAKSDGELFRVLVDSRWIAARKLILATGVVDELPPIADIQRYVGRGVFHCPYCDGWEFRDQPLVAYGRGSAGTQAALDLSVWSRAVTLCTDGPPRLDKGKRRRLEIHGIALHQERIEGLEGSRDRLEQIRFAGGRRIACRALFFTPRWRQHSDLATRMGCKLTSKGAVDKGAYECTNINGLYVAGDVSAEGVFAIGAAAEGAQAAVAVNAALLKDALAAKEKTY